MFFAETYFHSSKNFFSFWGNLFSRSSDEKIVQLKKNGVTQKTEGLVPTPNVAPSNLHLSHTKSSGKKIPSRPTQPFTLSVKKNRYKKSRYKKSV